LRIPLPRAPLCETNAMLPTGGSDSLKVALSPTAGSVLNTPKQFGPTSERWCSRARSMTSASSAAPASPTSRNPDEMTIAPFAPARPSSSMVSATRGAGTITTPSSGASGSARRSG